MLSSSTVVLHNAKRKKILSKCFAIIITKHVISWFSILELIHFDFSISTNRNHCPFLFALFQLLTLCDDLLSRQACQRLYYYIYMINFLKVIFRFHAPFHRSQPAMRWAVYEKAKWKSHYTMGKCGSKKINRYMYLLVCIISIYS